jgi:hypothetical protein
VLRDERGHYLAIDKHGGFVWSTKSDAKLGDTDAGTGDTETTMHFADEAGAKAFATMDSPVVQAHRTIEQL